MKIIRTILLVLGALLLIDGVFLLIFSNFNTGNILVFIFGTVLFLWGIQVRANTPKNEQSSR